MTRRAVARLNQLVKHVVGADHFLVYSAAVLYFCSGFATMIATVATLTQGRSRSCFGPSLYDLADHDSGTDHVAGALLAFRTSGR